MGLLDSKNSNPMFRDDVLDNFTEDKVNRMTSSGAFNKTFILLLVTVLTGALSWKFLLSFGTAVNGILIGASLVSVGVLYFAYKNPDRAPILAPIYAVLLGLMVGVSTAVYGYLFDGIVVKAALLTFGVMFTMLFLYKSGTIKVGDRFRSIMTVAVGTIMLFYAVNMVLYMFGVDVEFLHDGGPLSIGISLVIVVVASLQFLINFDNIEKLSAAGAPKNMEWIAGMGLLFNIVWLYLELLRLLSYLQD